MPRRRPGAVAVVAIHVNTVAAAERVAREIQITVAVEVGERRAEHAVRFAVGRKAVVPRRPRQPGAVAERHLDDLVAEIGRAVVVMHRIRDVGQAIAVGIPDRDAAVAEGAVLHQ